MNFALTKPLRQGLAVGLLLLAFIIAWVGVVRPLQKVAEQGWAQHRASIQELARLKALVAQQAELEQAQMQALADPVWQRLYEADSGTAAAAMLQSDIQSQAQALGIAIASMQPGAPADLGSFGKVSTRVSFNVPIDVLTRMLQQLASAQRIWLVEEATITAPQTRDVTTNPLLNVQLEVSGIWRRRPS